MPKHRTGHIFKRGKKFYLRWRINGKVFSKALHDAAGLPITTRRDAEEAKIKEMAMFVVGDETVALESVAAKLEGRKAELARLEDQQHPPLLIEQAWAHYLKAPNRPDAGESTLRQYQFQFTRFAKWMAANHPEAPTMRHVTREIAEAYASDLALVLSPNTFNKHVNLIQLLFQVLKERARLVANPWSDLKRKRLVTHTRRELTVEELRTACQSAKGELRLLFALGIYSGLRLGDCATLRWGEVDLGRGVIRRIPNKVARRNPKPVTVPLHAVLKKMLVEIPAEFRGEHVLPQTAALYLQRIDFVTDLVQRHFKKCGIKLYRSGTGKKGKRAIVEVGFHSLRHSFVSLCREAGVPLAVVESIVGHSNPAMTRHYTHIGETAALKAVATLPVVFGETDTALLKEKEANGVAVLKQIEALTQQMSVSNWEVIRGQILNLLSTTNEAVPPEAGG